MQLNSKVLVLGLLSLTAACGASKNEKKPTIFNNTQAASGEGDSAGDDSGSGTSSGQDSSANNSSNSVGSTGSSPSSDAAGTTNGSTASGNGMTSTGAGGTTVSGNANGVVSSCYKADDFTCKVEAAIVAQTNAYRTKALVQSFETSFVARDWSEKQAKANSIGHDGFPAARIAVAKAEFPNGKWSFFAENVAMFGGGDNSDPEEVAKKFVTMWYNSPGHKANMLGNYGHIGAGVYKDGNDFYATQIFY